MILDPLWCPMKSDSSPIPYPIMYNWVLSNYKISKDEVDFNRPEHSLFRTSTAKSCLHQYIRCLGSDRLRFTDFKPIIIIPWNSKVNCLPKSYQVNFLKYYCLHRLDKFFHIKCVLVSCGMTVRYYNNINLAGTHKNCLYLNQSHMSILPSLCIRICFVFILWYTYTL